MEALLFIKGEEAGIQQQFIGPLLALQVLVEVVAELVRVTESEGTDDLIVQATAFQIGKRVLPRRGVQLVEEVAGRLLLDIEKLPPFGVMFGSSLILSLLVAYVIIFIVTPIYVKVCFKNSGNGGPPENK